MKLRVMPVFLLIFFALNSLSVASTVIFVEEGDSYLGLFGADWTKVYEANSYLNKGGVPASPDTIVIGQRLIVPDNVHLTERAERRISSYESKRLSAGKAIKKAESLRKEIQGKNLAFYKEGIELLEKAKEASQGESYKFRNYVEAERLALEASRDFRIAKERAAVKRAFELFAWIMLFVLFTGVFFRQKNRRSRIKRRLCWLGGHQELIKKYGQQKKLSPM